MRLMDWKRHTRVSKKDIGGAMGLLRRRHNLRMRKNGEI